MANAIELAKSYVPKLDEVYKLAALTSVLDSDGAELKEGANAGEFIIPKMSMDGLGAYDRNNGYAQGSVTMENETVKANFDRGRKFVVDVADDLETAGLAFGKLSAEFIRTMVVPEVDAFRFAAYCGADGATKKEETLADGPAVIKAISAACSAMDDAEVPNTDRYLFITPALLQAVKDIKTAPGPIPPSRKSATSKSSATAATPPAIRSRSMSITRALKARAPLIPPLTPLPQNKERRAWKSESTVVIKATT